MTEENNNTEVKPEETKAEEVKAEEPKVEEIKAEEPKAEEVKPAEVKTSEVKPAGVKREERRPYSNQERKPYQKREQRVPRFRKKVCRFCYDKTSKIDYKNPNILEKFITDRGKILPRRVTGTCSKHQRQVATAIKRARLIALLPFLEK